MAYGAMSGSDATPYAAGTAFSKFYHAAADLGRFGAWAIVEGGMGSVTQALAGAVKSHGGEIRLEAPVAADPLPARSRGRRGARLRRRDRSGRRAVERRSEDHAARS